MNLDKPLKYQVSTWLDAVGKMAGVESLTFGMNISTWNYLVSQAGISSVLLGTRHLFRHIFLNTAMRVTEHQDSATLIAYMAHNCAAGAI